MTFNWNRSEVAGLAKQSCAHCLGLGLRHCVKTETDVPCNCVLRAVFRACYRRFKWCASRDPRIGTARMERVNGKDGRNMWGRKDEEFVADFCLVSKRTLTEDEHRIFRFHFLLGADWKLCCRRLNMDRGTFFHEVYSIQRKLGKVYRELQPYGLFPLDEYFGGTVRTATPRPSRKVIEMPSADRRRPVVPPLRKVA